MLRRLVDNGRLLFDFALLLDGKWFRRVKELDGVRFREDVFWADELIEEGDFPFGGVVDFYYFCSVERMQG